MCDLLHHSLGDIIRSECARICKLFVSKLIRTPLNGSFHCIRNTNSGNIIRIRDTIFRIFTVLNAFGNICPPNFIVTLPITNYYPHWKEEKTEDQ